MKDAQGREICTTDGRPGEEADLSIVQEGPCAGQQRDYRVLCDAERAKGFVRPLRRSYRHVGQRPTYQLRDLTDEERRVYASVGYVKYEKYPEEDIVVGRYWTQQQLDSGCGQVTTMGLSLCETYARDPKFYGATFCSNCGAHFPVAQFVWVEDGERVGS